MVRQLSSSIWDDVMETDLCKDAVTTVYDVHFIFLRPDVSQEQPSRLDTMHACVLHGCCIAEVLLCPHRLRCCSRAAPACPYCLHGVCLMIINKYDDLIFLYPLWKSEKAGGKERKREENTATHLLTYSIDTNITTVMKHWYDVQVLFQLYFCWELLYTVL